MQSTGFLKLSPWRRWFVKVKSKKQEKKKKKFVLILPSCFCNDNVDAKTLIVVQAAFLAGPGILTKRRKKKLKIIRNR